MTFGRRTGSTWIRRVYTSGGFTDAGPLHPPNVIDLNGLGVPEGLDLPLWILTCEEWVTDSNLACCPGASGSGDGSGTFNPFDCCPALLLTDTLYCKIIVGGTCAGTVFKLTWTGTVYFGMIDTSSAACLSGDFASNLTVTVGPCFDVQPVNKIGFRMTQLLHGGDECHFDSAGIESTPTWACDFLDATGYVDISLVAHCVGFDVPFTLRISKNPL